MTNPDGFTHSDLVKRAHRWLLNHVNCRFALCEVSCGTGESPDVIGWKYGFQSHLVEVKVSRSDFFADRDKPFRKDHSKGVGMFRWMMVPEAMISAEDLAATHPGWGLLWVKGRGVFQRVKALQQMRVSQTDEICILVQAVANAQLCAPMDLNEWFAHPETVVGSTRSFRRDQTNRQRKQDMERTCDSFTGEKLGGGVVLCKTLVATGYARCSEHGGRTRGEKRKQSEVVDSFLAEATK